MTSLPELPDHIIGHIISLASLTNREAIQISLLSKELFWAVQSRPALIFDGERQEELEYVHSTLVRYHDDGIPLDSFTFIYDSRASYDIEIMQKKCFRLAVKKKLRELDIQRIIDFPESVEFLLTLNLSLYGDLKGAYFEPWTSIVCPNLKRLCLVNLDMSLREFENIIIASPLIECLEVFCCFCESHFKVSNLCNLKQLCVGLKKCQTFEVKDAPELESINCSHRPLDRGHEINPIRNNIGNPAYQNLRTLSLDYVGGCDDFFNNFGHQFPRLENLSISNNKVLEELVLSSLSLKNIQLENIRMLKKARFDVPNVVLFEYKSTDTTNYYSIPELSFSGNPRGWISRIILSYRGFVSGIDNWFLPLHEFIIALNKSEISIIVTFKNLPYFEYSPKNAHRNILPMRPRVHEFRIESKLEFSLSFASAVVDNIFLICQPQTVTFEPRHRDKFESLLYQKQSSEVGHHSN